MKEDTINVKPVVRLSLQMVIKCIKEDVRGKGYGRK